MKKKKLTDYELDQQGLYPTVFYRIVPEEVEICKNNNIPIYKTEYGKYYLKYKEMKEIYTSLLPISLKEIPYTDTFLPIHLTLISNTK